MHPRGIRKGRGALRLHRETVRVLSAAELALVDGGDILVGATVVARVTYNLAPKTNGWSADLNAGCHL